MSAKKSVGKILVHQGGAAALNILNLRESEEVMIEEPVIPRLKELTWLDFANEHESTSNFSNEVPGVNFVPEKEKFSFINLLAGLPGDFIFFYKNKVKTILAMIQWILEEIGKLPFRLIFWFFKFLELYIARPMFGLFLKIFRGLWNFGRRVLVNIFWILKNGILAIIYFPRETYRFLRPAPAVSWSRSIICFLVICLVIVLPFGAYTHISKLKNTQGRVLGVTEAAYEYLKAAQAATQELDFGKANEEFRKANENFLLAQSEIDDLDFMMQGMLNVLPKGVAAQKILLAGQAMSEAGVYITDGLGIFHTNDANEDANYANMRMTDVDDANGTNITNDVDANQTNEANVTNIDLGVGDKVRMLREKFSLAYPRIVLAREALEEVDEALLPDENKENFLEIKNKVLALEKVSKKLESFSRIISEILAIDTSRRYLIIFQNESELRPTGGFMGSLALLDIRDGKIEQMEIPGGGPYDFKGSLTKRVAPPKPLQLVSSQWQFQDANWFSDFRKSAKKIMWFYENSGGATVDGVIAITSGLIPSLLELTGPIEMPEYGKVISADNFYLETQMAVEVEYDIEENAPKKFIADLTPKLIDKIINLPSENMVDLLAKIDLGLSQKKVMFYFSETRAEEEVLANNWGGEILATKAGEDYLYVVNANIGGGKTDNVIKQKIVHETEILEDGHLVDTVTIIRTHQGGAGHFFANTRNVNYLRVYAPEGSVLLEAKGFMPLGDEYFKELEAGLSVDDDLEKIEGSVLIEEISGTRITREFGKTVFGNWLILDPGETVICKLKYRLPWTLERDLEEGSVYTLLMQKQPGSKEDRIEKIMFLPGGSDIAWNYPEDEYVGQYDLPAGRQGEMVKFRGSLGGDKYYGLIFDF